MSEEKTNSFVQIAESVGAVSYSPPPLRQVKGVSFTFEQLDAFATTIIQLPWRKPSERPEIGKDCLFLFPSMGQHPHGYIGRTTDDNPFEFYSDDGDTFPTEEVICWMYVSELPLPSWVQK